jgi:hypothetical protein
MTRQHVDPANLIDRRIYRLSSRNLIIGAWNAEENGFIGIREKWGSEYLFTEYEADFDPHVGTARAIDDMGIDVPPEIRMHEHAPREIEIDSWWERKLGGERRFVTMRFEERCQKFSVLQLDDNTLGIKLSDESLWNEWWPVNGTLEINEPLFDLLKGHEERAYELREAETDREQAEYEAKRAAMTPMDKHLEQRQSTSMIVNTRNHHRRGKPGALHRFEMGKLDKKGSKPEDPGWWECMCGTWEGYWSDYNKHVAGDQIDMLTDAGVLPRPEAQETHDEDQAH